MKKLRVYLFPFAISLSNGILSIFGLSAGYERYFFIVAILSAVIIIGLNNKNRLLSVSLYMGVLIMAATGIPQVVFMDLYFKNNPDYVALADTLPMEPRTYTLLMIPVIGLMIGLLIEGLAWIMRRIVNK